MESRSGEPLQTLSCQHNSRLRSPTANSLLKKKKKRRRRRRRTPKSDTVGRSEANVAVGSPTSSREAWTPRQGSPAPVLRPVGAQVPRAPENSTQFIMDDHENSTLFVNFDNFSTPHWEQEPPVSGAEDETGGGTPTHALTRDWFPFNAADFETAYRSAREDRLMAGSSSELRAAIVALEARAAVLTDALSSSPSRIVSRLQTQLLHLQEENAILRQHLSRRNQKRRPSLQSSSSSSTDSDSESDSTNSSSDCSESDCDTCAARRRRAVQQQDEEKENTCPHPMQA
ncbi:uncharacterized protein LOC135089114 [Scylla paramamosain]|uniref:uncharacterized protein LOC135089114 n=1 Tax=Scylla paramamosain TaxID=85552 RepID=UPI0030828B9F